MQRPFILLTFFYLTFVQAVLGFSHNPSKRMVKAQHKRAASPTAGVDMSSELSLWKQHSGIVDSVKSAMLASIRTSWEQGTAANGILETDNDDYSVFAASPFTSHGQATSALQLALSAVVRQTADGRLSQDINDAEDGAALDGASAGSAVLLGTFAPNPRGQSYWESAADKELNYLLTEVPRTSTGALSHRADSAQYWADGVFMGPPFLAYYGAVKKNQTLVQMAYDNCRLYRDALLIDGPTGKLWAHIYDDTNKTWTDEGIWASGNAWAALGMSRVAATIKKSPFANEMTSQINDLNAWTKEILDGVFAALNSDNLVPDYIQGGPNFSDCSASSALASVAFRSVVFFPETFGVNYTLKALKIRDAVVQRIDSMGVLAPVVDPLSWSAQGVLSTEAQAFALMMFAGWKVLIGQ